MYNKSLFFIILATCNSTSFSAHTQVRVVTSPLLEAVRARDLGTLKAAVSDYRRQQHLSDQQPLETLNTTFYLDGKYLEGGLPLLAYALMLQAPQEIIEYLIQQGADTNYIYNGLLATTDKGIETLTSVNRNLIEIFTTEAIAKKEEDLSFVRDVLNEAPPHLFEAEFDDGRTMDKERTSKEAYSHYVAHADNVYNNYVPGIIKLLKDNKKTRIKPDANRALELNEPVFVPDPDGSRKYLRTTHLIQAIEKPNVPLNEIRNLLEQGANPNIPSEVNELYPLYHAVYAKRPDIVALLFEFGAVDTTDPSSPSSSPLQRALWQQDNHSLKLLLSHATALQNKHLKAMIDVATHKNDYELLNAALLPNGASDTVSLKNYALDSSIKTHNVAMARSLLQQGAQWGMRAFLKALNPGMEDMRNVLLPYVQGDIHQYMQTVRETIANQDEENRLYNVMHPVWE